MNGIIKKTDIQPFKLEKCLVANISKSNSYKSLTIKVNSDNTAFGTILVTYVIEHNDIEIFKTAFLQEAIDVYNET